jgi:hypothetical protein
MVSNCDYAHPGGFSFASYFYCMDDLNTAIAVDQWIREVDSARLGVSEIAISFQAFCQEFDIPANIGKKAIAEALKD